jgi:hypothetical protein
MRISFVLFFIIQLSNHANAQLEKIIHQTFEIGETQEIALDLFGEYEVVYWAGTNVMTETRIQLYEASSSILNHFVDKMQRYSVEADTSGGKVLIYHKDKKRENIRTRNGNQCTEIITLKVFIPDSFKSQNEKLMVRTKQ